MNFKKVLLLTLFLPVLVFVALGPAKAQYSDTFDFLQAVEENDMATARSKLFAGANVNGRREGVPIFIVALKKGYYDMARLLLENGAYVNMPSIPQQETALMVAASAGDETAVKLLLEFKADMGAVDRVGQTALMKAAQSRKTGTAKLLIENGADVFQTDYAGRDALQYAREGRAPAIIKLLEDAGAG